MTIILHCTFIFAFGMVVLSLYVLKDLEMEAMTSQLKTSYWHSAISDYKRIILLYALNLIALYMFLHAYTCVLMFITYCDYSNRQLNSIYNMTSQIAVSRMANKQIVNSMITKVCELYTKQRVFHLVVWDVLQAFSLVHLFILIPVLILWIYICIRFFAQISWFLYIPNVLSAELLCLCIILIHIFASCLHEHSCRILKNCQKNIVPFKTRHPYWKKKFRSLRDIRVGALWWYFSYANLLPMSSHVFTATNNLLLL